jgi:GntR family phosphonate transport system transcriptional regulator
MTRDTSELDWLNALSWIRSRKMKPALPETRLPSEDALAKESGFTRAVVRRALQHLVENDELISKKGSGYFTIYNLNRAVTMGKSLEPNNAVTDDTEVHDFGVVESSEEVGRYLKVRAGEDVIYFKTKRFLSHKNFRKPCLMSKHYIRTDKVNLPRFEENLRKYRSVSSAVRYEGVSAYLRTFTEAICRLPDTEERSALIIGPLDIVIETRGVNADAAKDPIELTMTYWPAHIWTLKFEF